MIIDCHCHAGKGNLLTGPWDTNAAIEPYLKRTRAAGIDKTVIFSPFHSNYEQANANTARLATRFPGRLRSTLTVIAEQFGTVTYPTVIDRLLQPGAIAPSAISKER